MFSKTFYSKYHHNDGLIGRNVKTMLDLLVSDIIVFINFVVLLYNFTRMFFLHLQFYTPRKRNDSWDILESDCLSIHVSICVSVCVQNYAFCQSAGRGIESHSVTALVLFWNYAKLSFQVLLYHEKKIMSSVDLCVCVRARVCVHACVRACVRVCVCVLSSKHSVILVTTQTFSWTHITNLIYYLKDIFQGL